MNKYDQKTCRHDEGNTEFERGVLQCNLCGHVLTEKPTKVSDKSCEQCVFYKDLQNGYSAGHCDYPLPEFLRINITGGNFVMATAANNCQTYKSLSDVKELETNK